MSLFSIALVLLIEQWRPLHERVLVQGPLARYADFLEQHFNAGERQHGIIAWLIAVGPVLIAAALAYWVAASIHPLLGLAVNVAVLYLTMGFRQASHYFTDIQKALREGEIERARMLLEQWRGRSAHNLSREDITRLAIEEALAGAHRLVFGVMFWFVLLPGPAGAILYRLAGYLAGRWGSADEGELGQFGWFARNAYRVLDWVPARLTAISFAVVGDFEDAIYCWRTQAARWFDRSLGIVLAAGAGALGIRLGNPLPTPEGAFEERPELGLGDDPDNAHLDSVIGLVWRALVLWLAMILIVSIARAIS